MDAPWHPTPFPWRAGINGYLISGYVPEVSGVRAYHDPCTPAPVSASIVAFKARYPDHIVRLYWHEAGIAVAELDPDTLAIVR